MLPGHSNKKPCVPAQRGLSPSPAEGAKAVAVPSPQAELSQDAAKPGPPILRPWPDTASHTLLSEPTTPGSPVPSAPAAAPTRTAEGKVSPWPPVGEAGRARRCVWDVPGGRRSHSWSSRAAQALCQPCTHVPTHCLWSAGGSGRQRGREGSGSASTARGRVLRRVGDPPGASVSTSANWGCNIALLLVRGQGVGCKPCGGGGCEQ